MHIICLISGNVEAHQTKFCHELLRLLPASYAIYTEDPLKILFLNRKLSYETKIIAGRAIAANRHVLDKAVLDSTKELITKHDPKWILISGLITRTLRNRILNTPLFYSQGLAEIKLFNPNLSAETNQSKYLSPVEPTDLAVTINLSQMNHAQSIHNALTARRLLNDYARTVRQHAA